MNNEMNIKPEMFANVTLANLGDSLAQNRLGHAFEDRTDGVQQDWDSAFKWHNLAANDGNADSQFCLGRFYYNGNGVVQDLPMALKWYELSARQGFAPAQNNLGTMYFNGEAVTQDMTTAIELFSKAADAGNADAQNNLGSIFFGGQGVNTDLEQALKWWLLSAKQSNPKAQLSLGLMYLNGIGVEQSDSNAHDWLKLSAEQGDESAQMHLGNLYVQGYGNSENIEEGVWWLQCAAEQGNSIANELLSTMQGHESTQLGESLLESLTTPLPMVGEDSHGQRWLVITVEEVLWSPIHYVTLGGMGRETQKYEIETKGVISHKDIVLWGFREIARSRGEGQNADETSTCVQGDSVIIDWRSQSEPNKSWRGESRMTYAIPPEDNHTFSYIGNLSDYYYGNDEGTLSAIRVAKLRIIDDSEIDDDERKSWRELVLNDCNIMLSDLPK